MAFTGQEHNGAEWVPGAREARPCGWIRVSWADLARLCRRLAEQCQADGRPEVVVALARAGYVPGAILASLLRCDLLTLVVPPARERGSGQTERSVTASLRDRVRDRRVLVFDETARTGESLAWAVGIVTDAGALAVRTAVLIHPPGGPVPDYWAVTADIHLLQPWLGDCLWPAAKGILLARSSALRRSPARPVRCR
ncbi:MAG: phosphoribosyltransferase family protein [Armatimonadota bacterium]|nr:phosphoribosyltransferase family protein [Armatimonadota bacterium]